MKFKITKNYLRVKIISCIQNIFALKEGELQLKSFIMNSWIVFLCVRLKQKAQKQVEICGLHKIQINLKPLVQKMKLH